MTSSECLSSNRRSVITNKKCLKNSECWVCFEFNFALSSCNQNEIILKNIPSLQYLYYVSLCGPVLCLSMVVGWRPLFTFTLLLSFSWKCRINLVNKFVHLNFLPMYSQMGNGHGKGTKSGETFYKGKHWSWWWQSRITWSWKWWYTARRRRA